MRWKPWNHQLLWRLQIESPVLGQNEKSWTQSTLTILFSGWHKKGSHRELNQEQSCHNFFKLLPHEEVTSNQPFPPPHLKWAMERNDSNSRNRIVRMRYWLIYILIVPLCSMVKMKKINLHAQHIKNQYTHVPVGITSQICVSVVAYLSKIRVIPI